MAPTRRGAWAMTAAGPGTAARRALTAPLSLVVALMLVPGLVSAEPQAGGGPLGDWKTEANSRIEQIRKRDVEIVVADRYGHPVPVAGIQASQRKHDFAFGSCINTNALSNPEYASFFLQHFEWAVFENESKWFFNEPQRDFENYSSADALVEFCEQNGILIRGHCIFWAKEEYTPGWCRSLPPGELSGEVDERLDHAVPRFKGHFLHWDVNNEMLDGDFFRRKLGAGIEPYMFIRAHELDPGALLFVNDYSTVECCSGRVQAYINQVRSLQAAGAPVHGVGVQGHYWTSTVDPVGTLARLDQLSSLGLPIWFTEYDTVNADENARAEALENLYRAAFSHPSVHGILMWGFWAGSHWRGADAAIVDLDWTVNAAGRRYEDLMAEWTTNGSGATGPDGSYHYRGFHGTYEVTTQAGGAPIVSTFQVPPAAGPAVFLVPLKDGACFPAREVRSVRLAHDGGTSTTTLSWDMIPWRSDMASTTDVLRSADPADFETATVCLETDDGSDAAAIDMATPAAGSVFFYLVRGEYDCHNGEGSLGAGSDGTQRTGRICR